MTHAEKIKHLVLTNADALIHCAVAIPLTVLLMASGLTPLVAALWTAAIFFMREWDQRSWGGTPVNWSMAKHIEWVAPSIVGLLVARFVFYRL